MMLHWLQKTGGKPIPLMGGGTTRVGDPSGKDEARKLLSDRADRGQQGGHPQGLRQVPRLRRRRDRRDHDRQRRMADEAQLHRLPARRRPALLGQPHAVDGFGEAAARARAGAVVHRVQLHVPAGLRFRRAQPPLRLRAADGRLGPVGQHRHRHRSRPAHGHAAALRAHRAAAHHRLGREDGQDGGGRRLAQRRHADPLRLLAVLAQHGGRATSAASCRLFTTLPHGRDRAARSAGRRGDQRGEEGSRQRGDRAAARPRGGRTRPPRPRARRSRKASSPRACRRSACRRRGRSAWAC